MRLLEMDIGTRTDRGDVSELEMMIEGGIDRLPMSEEKETEAGTVREEKGTGAGRIATVDTVLPVDILGQRSEAIIMALRKGNGAARVSQDIGGIEKTIRYPRPAVRV